MGCFSKVLSPAILSILLLFLWIPTSAHIQSKEEWYISALISEKGIDFVKSFLINKATSSIIPLKLPDIQKSLKIPLLGKVEMVLSDIIIYNVHIHSSDAETGERGVMLAVSGVTANLSMNWKYSYGTWLLPTISDSGTASVLVEGMEVGLTVALQEQGGTIKLSLLDCGSHIKDISIKLDGGASWLYQALIEAFQGKIRSAVEDGVTKKIREEITELDSLLESLPKQIPVDDIAAMNVTFVNSPVLINSSVELEISGLFTATSAASDLSSNHEGSQSSASCNHPAKMVGIALHENVFRSGALVYFNANRMHWMVDKVPDKSLLNTSGWRYIVPKLYKQYPNDEMNLNISVTSPPIILVSKHDIDAAIYIDVTINVLDSKKVVPIACISLILSASCSPRISRNNLSGIIRLINFTASLKWSNIGNLNMYLVQSVMSIILQTAFLPYVNLRLRRGFPLPLPHGFTFQNAEIFCINSWVVICCDLGLDRIN